MGPLLVHDNYSGPSVSAGKDRCIVFPFFFNSLFFRKDVLETCCNCCGKRNATKMCTGCKSARYCDQICQKQAWKDHKPKCVPMTPQQIKETEEKIAEAEAKAKGVQKLDVAD
jgi:hypothetical protein